MCEDIVASHGTPPNQSMSQLRKNSRAGWPHFGTTTSACLPQHPAVAYLFLVRPMKQALTTAITLLTVSCAELRHGFAPLTRDRAVLLALAEFHKRGITVSPRWRIKAFPDVHIPELHPEVPIYVVEFFDPARSTTYPLYIVTFHRYTWELDGFS